MKNTYAVIDRTESFAQSFFSDLVTFSFIGFCALLSQENRFWTVVTGICFLLFVWAKIAVLLKLRSESFTTKEELIRWAESLDWGSDPHKESYKIDG